MIQQYGSVFSLLILLWMKPNLAYGQESSDEVLQPQVTIEYRNVLHKDKSELLSANLAKVRASPWFNNRLPLSFGMILDGNFTASEGYYSPLLITYDLKTGLAVPAILFSDTLFSATRSLQLMAHELTHLMQAHLWPQSGSIENSWLREGLALMAEWMISTEQGYPGHNPALMEAFRFPETSLVAPLTPEQETYKDVRVRTAEYGHILQYFIYIYRLCGGKKLLEELLAPSSLKTGLALLDEALPLQHTGYAACANFHESFVAFSLARFHQGTAPEDYVYVTALESPIRESPVDLPPYSSTVYRRTPNQKCALHDWEWGTSRCIRIRER